MELEEVVHISTLSRIVEQINVFVTLRIALTLPVNVACTQSEHFHIFKTKADETNEINDFTRTTGRINHDVH